MRAGRLLIVTAPLAAVTVTGNAAAAALADGAAEPAGADVDVDVLLLPDEPQPASATAATTAAARAAAALAPGPDREGGFIWGHFLPEMREGRRDRRSPRATPAAAGTDRPSHEGRYRPARQESTWLGPRGRGRHSCGTAPEWPADAGFTGFAA